ncbi:NUDIX hydrolase [Spirochaetia bacterium]|nr:NUDIX hydrolase [Spirochaetia bacterium]
MAEMKERESVAGIALKDGRVFIARRKEGGDLGGKWEFPGGKVRPGESAAQALAREFAEELDIPVRAGEQIGEAAFIHKDTRFRLTAWLVTPESENFAFNEHTEYRWVTADEMDSLDFAGSDRQLFPAVRKALARL